MRCSIDADPGATKDASPELDGRAVQDDQIHVCVEASFESDVGALT
jgi:hypothetical protein